MDDAERITGFKPLVGGAPRALVLGSMPSVASLEKHEYYGKPQNAFWRIMGAIFDAGPELEYDERVHRVTEAGLAVWDVLASCVRPGSLDSAIEANSMVVNRFPEFFAQYPSIEHVFFNGRKAEEVFRRRVLGDLKDRGYQLNYHGLPSTSPAMAVLNFEAKLERWKVLADAVSGTAR